jgi:hypothetical protein
MTIQQECRRESFEKLNVSKRQRQVINVFIGDWIMGDGMGLTAQEVAENLYNMRLVPDVNRNFAAPRITELLDLGILQSCSKRFCAKTGRNITVWGFTNRYKDYLRLSKY